MGRIFFLLAVLAIVAREGACIRCYSCTPDESNNCLDMSRVSPEECTSDFTKGIIAASGSILKDWGLSHFSNFLTSEMEIVCAKATLTHGSEKAAFRTCFPKAVDFCGKVHLLTKNQLRVEFCGTCNHDACNGARHLGPLSLAFYLIVSCIIALIALKY